MHYLYLKQRGEGCDYTIGCGNTLVALGHFNDRDNGRAMKEAVSRALEDRSIGTDDDRIMEEALVLVVAPGVDVMAMIKDRVDTEREEDRVYHEKKDREELERLKAKLGE